MNGKTKRDISAFFLLAIYVSILLFSSFHVHSQALSLSDDCEQCVNHVPHSGHLSPVDGAQHVCLLCQFLNLTFIAATGVAVIIYINVRAKHVIPPLTHAVHVIRGVVGLRAPPFGFV